MRDGKAGVQFKVNGNSQGSEDQSAPYSTVWDTSFVPNGTYTLTAVARDEANLTTTSPAITVTVNNPDILPPTVSITAPPGGGTVTGTVTVSANAADEEP